MVVDLDLGFRLGHVLLEGCAGGGMRVEGRKGMLRGGIVFCRGRRRWFRRDEGEIRGILHQRIRKGEMC